METAGKATSDGRLGSADLKNILSKYSKKLDEFAETINIYESSSAVLVESKIDELSHLHFQEIENALRVLPKLPSFQLRTQIFNSIKTTNGEFRDKMHAAQQQYESALVNLKIRLTEAFLNMVNSIVDAKTEAKTAEILHVEAIKLILVRMGALDQKEQKLVQKLFEDNTAELLSSMTLVEEALMTYRKDMSNHFKLYRCMSCELFSKLHKQAEMTARAKLNSDFSPFFVELTNGITQMHKMFSGMNEVIVKSENNLVLEMNQREPRIVILYKEMMKNEKQDDYQIPEFRLKEVNENVKLVEGVKKLSEDTLVGIATKVIYNQRRIYNCKMEECLKNAGGMIDTLQLEKHHIFYLTDAGNTVVFELKKIKGLESHLNYEQILKRQIESDWLQLKMENNKKKLTETELSQKEEMKWKVTVNKTSEQNVLMENVLQTRSQLNKKMYFPQDDRQVPSSFTLTPKNPFATKSSATDMQPQSIKNGNDSSQCTITNNIPLQKTFAMPRAKCCWCAKVLRSGMFPRPIGESHFWEAFIGFVSESTKNAKPINQYSREEVVCPTCHGKIRMHMMRTSPTETVESSGATEDDEDDVHNEMNSGRLEEERKNAANQNQVLDGPEEMCHGLESEALEGSREVEINLHRLSEEVFDNHMMDLSRIESDDEGHFDEDDEGLFVDENLLVDNAEDSIAVSLCSGGTEVLPSDSEKTVNSQMSDASTIYLFKSLQTVGSSEKKCMVCKSTQGRCRIPKKALWQVWQDKQILIPTGNRTCSSHLVNSRFNAAALEIIQTTKIGVEMTGNDLGNWILEVTANCVSTKPIHALTNDTMSLKDYNNLFGLEKTQFENLLMTYVEPSEMRNTTCRSKKEALAMFLLVLRKNMDQETIGFLFNCSQTVVSTAVSAVSSVLLESFVPKFLGFQAMPRDRALLEHNRSILHDILELGKDQLALIEDGTYIFVEQPLPYKLQRLLFSGHKKRHLVKPMMLVFASGWILECFGPYGANGTNNDATIMQHLLINSELQNYAQPNDRFLIDRGFQNVAGEIEEAGYSVFMPALLKKNQAQFTTEEANKTRKITKNRWVVESVNGRLKNVWRFFKHTVEGSYTPSIMKFCRIACALLNCYFVPLQKELPEHKEIALKVREREHLDNTLQKKIDDMNIQGRLLVSSWEKAAAEVLEDFPTLTMEQLEEISLGEYQLKMGLRYVKEHMTVNGDFEIYLYRHDDPEGPIISARLQSRFRSCVKHLLWLQYNPDLQGTEAITGKYCRCAVGARTIGMCSHIAAVLRYLSFDRHQPPATKRKRVGPQIIDAKARIMEIRAQENPAE